MTTIPLTTNAPLARRIRAWAGERFPLANSVLALVLYLAALLTGRALTSSGELWLDASDLAGFAGVWGYFLMLRVFDEHKDFHLDNSNHPDRVLQRGLVTLGHLKLVGSVAIALQVVAVLIAGAALWWAVTLAWSLLMLKEFFAGEWLERHFVLYAASHLLAMPLALLWMAQMGAGERPLPASVAWLAAAGLALAAALEVARKVRAPSDERLGVTTYTKLFGVGAAAAAVGLLMTAFTVAIGVLLGALAAGSVAAFGVLAIALAAALAACEAFALQPTRSAAARVETVAGAAALAGLLVVVVALAIERGF